MKFVDQIQAHPVRFLKTLALFSAGFAGGFQAGLTSPTLPDYGLAVGVSFQKLTYIMPLTKVGATIGACISMIY